MSADERATAHRYPVMTSRDGPCFVARIGGRSAVYGLRRAFVPDAVELTQRFRWPTGAGTTGWALLSIPAEDGLYQGRGWARDGAEERRFWQVTDGQATELEREAARAIIDSWTALATRRRTLSAMGPSPGQGRCLSLGAQGMARPKRQEQEAQGGPGWPWTLVSPRTRVFRGFPACFTTGAGRCASPIETGRERESGLAGPADLPRSTAQGRVASAR